MKEQEWQKLRPLLLHNLALAGLDQALQQIHQVSCVPATIISSSVDNTTVSLFNLQVLLEEPELSGLLLLGSLHRPEQVAVRLQNPQNLDF